MTETLPAWLKIDNELGDLSKIVPQLKTYADLAEKWRDIAFAVRKLAADVPVDSPINLLRYLASKVDDEQIAEIFEELGLSTLHAQLAHVGGEMIDAKSPWAKLLQPTSGFVETYLEKPTEEGAFDDGDNPGLVRLNIPKLAAAAEASVEPASFDLALGGTVKFECEAGAVWPFRSDSVAPGLLRIGATGAFEGKAGISLPFGKIGSGAATGEGSVGAELNYFYRHARPDLVYAAAVASALISLPNPLNLSEINHAIRLVGMEGAVLACDGKVSAGLSAALGKDFSFEQLASVSAKMVAQLEFNRTARWVLSLRNTGSGLNFVLSRALTREQDWSAGLHIGLDYSGLAKQVHDALSETLDLIGPELESIRPFLSPGTYISENLGVLLNKTVGSIVSEPTLKAALVQDLGRVLGQSGSKDSALASYIRDYILDAAASYTGGVTSQADAWAQHIADGISEKFPALSPSAVKNALVAQIKPLLTEVKAKFDSTVTELAAQATISKSLSDIGVELDETLDKADQLTAGIRDVVAKFDAFSKEVREKTGEGIQHKLAAKFGWNGGASGGEQYELIGSFDQVNEETSALWRALVTGRLEPFQRILASPEAAPVGLHLDPKSSLSRFAGKYKGFSLELAVLGLSLSIKSIIKAEAAIELSAGGDVTVFAKGTAEVEVAGFKEGRSASFVNTWDLALLKSQDASGGGNRKMSVSLRLDHSDKDLEPKEVDGFLSGLGQAGLIESSRVKRAQEIYQGWKLANTGKTIQGTVEVGFAMTTQTVLRMVALGRICGKDGTQQHRAVFTTAAQALLLSGATDTDRLDRDCREARREFKELAKVDDPWQILYALRTVDLTPPEVAGHRGYSYAAFGKLMELSKSFPRILFQMAQIYDAIPVGAVGTGTPWSEKDYVRAEMALARDARRWLRLNQKLLFWFKSDMHPAAIAFLRLLADLNQVMATDNPLEGFDARLDTARSDNLFSITMKPSNGKSVSV
jgi:hypothetical protein